MAISPDDVPHRSVLVGVTGVYTVAVLILFGISGLVSWLGGDLVDFPLGYRAVWDIPADVLGGLRRTFWLFLWGTLLTVGLGLVLIYRYVPREARPGTVFLRGTWLSLNAGFFEEIIFRWLLLIIAPAVLVVLNFVSFGLIRWLYGTILIPIANTTTLGILEPQLTDANWLLGAAIISVNGRFRRGHAHHGLFATVNSWFIGMVMFYLLFNFGMWAAIVAHIAYDLCVFWTAAFMSLFQPYHVRGWY